MNDKVRGEGRKIRGRTTIMKIVISHGRREGLSSRILFFLVLLQTISGSSKLLYVIH